MRTVIEFPEFIQKSTPEIVVEILLTLRDLLKSVRHGRKRRWGAGFLKITK